MKTGSCSRCIVVRRRYWALSICSVARSSPSVCLSGHVKSMNWDKWKQFTLMICAYIAWTQYSWSIWSIARVEVVVVVGSRVSQPVLFSFLFNNREGNWKLQRVILKRKEGMCVQNNWHTATHRRSSQHWRYKQPTVLNDQDLSLWVVGISMLRLCPGVQRACTRSLPTLPWAC